VQCLHRWQRAIRPGIVKGAWTKEEEAIIRDAVSAGGGVTKIKWSVIAEKLPGRLAKQVQERWNNNIDPGLNKEPWTEAEVSLIMRMRADDKSWGDIVKCLTVSGKECPGRRGGGVLGCRVCSRVVRYVQKSCRRLLTHVSVICAEACC